jgi:hypothetical protein
MDDITTGLRNFSQKEEGKYRYDFKYNDNPELSRILFSEVWGGNQDNYYNILEIYFIGYSLSRKTAKVIIRRRSNKKPKYPLLAPYLDLLDALCLPRVQIIWDGDGRDKEDFNFIKFVCREYPGGTIILNPSRFSHTPFNDEDRLIVARILNEYVWRTD